MVKASTDPREAADAAHYHHTGNWAIRRISMIARVRVYKRFVQSMQPKPSDRILDVGASDDTGPDSNMLEQLYPHRQKLTCASLSDSQSLLAAYRG
ncbi:MAG TPA: hypothetical protein VL970_04305 [Candidatus Acidoferrales bacterium]|nr:hypothetical protein [Candidatus Acidoferrales bacterium]